MIDVTNAGRVRTLTFSRPESLNAFTHDMYSACEAALREAAEDGGVAAVVLTGAGRAFCAGQDLGEMAAVGNRNRAGSSETPDVPHGFQGFMAALTEFPKPVLAAVNGVGVGLGVTMLLHCDVVLISSTARLRAPFTALGVVPEAGSSLLLPVSMGWQAAAHFVFTSGWMDAETAVRTGLAWRLCPPGELMDATLEVAHEIAAKPIVSLVATKRLMQASRREALAAARAREDVEFAQLTGAPANREAVAAFLEKRQPDFTKIGE